MAEEPRRSGRATKGQHKNSSSPAPQAKPSKQPSSKPKQPPTKDTSASADYDDEEEKIRCVCGDDNPKDKRAFIGCEACEVWQHNICMGEPEDEDEVPEHYFCEECRPEEHGETLAAMARGERIWEVRGRIYANERKAGSKRKGKGGKGSGGWLKKDVIYDPDGIDGEEIADGEESEMVVGSKRKRNEEGEATATPQQRQDVKMEEDATEEKNTRTSRQDKRRKPTLDTENNAATSETPSNTTPLLPINELPKDRHAIATALSKILLEELNARSPTNPENQSAADYHAAHIEHALLLTYDSTSNPQYREQFRTLNANLKKNKVLISRLLEGSLTAEELSTMNSKDMASEELQKERAVMKEQLDRQAVAVQVEEDRPRFRRTHKGDEEIEDGSASAGFFQTGGGTDGVGVGAGATPVRERSSVQDGAGSPSEAVGGSPEPLKVDTVRSQSFGQQPQATGLERRRTSSQQFDMNNIWAKTAQSPTSSTTPGGGGGVAGGGHGTRPMQMPPRRSSMKPHRPQSQDGSGGGGGGGGTKEDADIDRMLQDDNYDDEDETYSPADYATTSPENHPSEGIVWRGKLIQSADTAVSPTVNARFVAGRNLASTYPWRHLLPSHLSIDGRLQIAKAEEYLCSLQWSQSSDVSILALTPAGGEGDKEGFESVFQYFKTRERYAVVNKGKPTLVKDLYVIPVEQGQEVPSHVGMLEFNRFGGVVGEKCLLASLVVARSATPVVGPGQAGAVSGQLDGAGDVGAMSQEAVAGAGAAMNGGQQGQQHTMLPQHVRSAVAGPAGSPLNAGSATFSPPSSSTTTTTTTNMPLQTQPTGAAAPGDGSFNNPSLPPNPYGGAVQQQQQPPAAAYNNPLINEILGSLQYAPTAKDVIDADPGIEREKLVHLKQILEEDPKTRTDIGALYGYLTRAG